MTDIAAFSRSRANEWIAFRRDLHRYPERGFLEYCTQAKIAQRLSDLGFRLRFGHEVMSASSMMGVPDATTIAAAQHNAIAQGARPDYVERMANGMTGIVAEIGNGNGPVVAMRFDVDALPLTEALSPGHRPLRLGFASKIAQVMHACGHDGHATIGVGVAEAAAHSLNDWNGTLRLIFQPAEEGGRGALSMVEAGIVNDADILLAFHIGCDLPSKQLATSASEMMFSAKWDLRFHGLAAHAAANPEKGRNALLAAAQATVALYTLPRHGSAATHVNVGRLNAGTARNVIADAAFMEVEVRGGTEDALLLMERRARAIIDGAAAGQDCTVDIKLMGRTIGAPSSAGLAQRAHDVAMSLQSFSKVLDAWPLGGGDDAAFFMRRVQERGGEAAYLILGSDLAAGHHATSFDFEESDIVLGVRLLHGILMSVAGIRK